MTKRSNSALPEAERYRLLVEAVTDYAIYMLDPTGIVTSWNIGAQNLKGYTAAEIVGRHFSCFYTEEDRLNGLPGRFLETAARESKYEGEGWRIRKDGSRFWAFVVIDPIRDPNGRLIGFAKITRDLTERKRVEEELQRSEERFRLLVEGVTDYAIYMLDTDGIVTNWNLGAERIKGYLRDEIVGRHFSQFYSEDDRTRGEPARGLETAAREGRFEIEGWRIRKDGTRFWANVVIDAIRDQNGALLGFAKITRDITERRATQDALDRARMDLLQSQKMEAIGKLTGGVAHDFNNLLTVVLSSLELLRRYVPDNPRAARLIDNAMQGAQRGATLTQRMLAFARRQELDVSPVDIPRLVHNMSDLLRRSLGPLIALEIRFPPDLDAAMVDAQQLETALLNLAINSRDAMPEGGLLVITARPGDDGDVPTAGRHIRLSIIDNGEGMNEQTLARASEPFFTTKGIGKGTGLGLSMVQGMIEQLGGQFRLASARGQGTTVELLLPSATRAAVAAEPVEAAAAAQTPPLTVLTVDDDALVLASSVAMLENLGHAVIPALNGGQALEKIVDEPAIDLVITDHAMPTMTGAELAQAIATCRPGLPVLLATGYAELAESEGGTLPRLSKPYRQEQLAAAISEAMRQRPPRSKL